MADGIFFLYWFGVAGVKLEAREEGDGGGAA
jgi:hypothetical protein